MNPTIVSLFVSSTNLDLAEEREAVRQMLRGLREAGFLGKEYFGGCERASLEEVDKSQLYILLLGGLYGSGAIEEEYRRARDRGLPCLIYCNNEESRETGAEAMQRLAAFKDELAQHHQIAAFSGPAELTLRMRNDLFRWNFDHHLIHDCATAAIGSIDIEQQCNYRLEVGSEHGAILHARQTSPEHPGTIAEPAAPRHLPGPQAATQPQSEAAEWINDQALASLTEHEKRVIALLGAANGASLAAGAICSLTGIPEIAPILDSLFDRKLIESRAGRHRLCEPPREFLPGAWDLSDWHQRLFDYFSQWMEAHRQAPDRVQAEWEAVFALPDWSRAAGRAPLVIRLGLALDPSLALGGQWELWEQALQKILLAARVEDDRACEAWALHQLGTHAFCLREAENARRLLSESLELRVSLGEHAAASVTRHNLDFLLPQELAQEHIATTDPFPIADAAQFPDEVVAAPSAARKIQVIPIAGVETPRLPEDERFAWLSRRPRRVAFIGVATLLVLIGGMTIARFKSRRVPQPHAAASPAPDSLAAASPQTGVDPAVPSPSPGLSPTPTPAANAPQMIVSTDLLTFDPVEPGSAARAQLAIKNESGVPLVISGIKLIGANAEDFKLAGNCSRRIAAKQDCILNLEFWPRQPGGREAALMIASNAAGPRYVALKGDAPAPAPRLEAAPGKVDFGLSISKAAGNQEIITLRNAGSAPLTISSLSLAETGAFVFNDINCRGRALAPRESCSLSLGFRPNNDGDYNASLIVQSNARNNPFTVPLEGRRQLIASRTPTLAVYPSLLRLSFTGKPYNDRKLTRGLLRLSNPGEVSVTVNDVGMDGPNAASFQLTHKCKGAQLAPGAQCDIEIVFAPGQNTALADHRARVLVTIHESQTAQTAILNGAISIAR